jgi:hypothetical protein
MSVIIPGLGRISWQSLTPGLIAAAVGAIAFKPLLVGTIKAGYEAVDATKDAWNEAKGEVERGKQESLAAGQTKGIETELRQLREEVAQLRAQAAKRG